MIGVHGISAQNSMKYLDKTKYSPSLHLILFGQDNWQKAHLFICHVCNKKLKLLYHVENNFGL